MSGLVSYRIVNPEIGEFQWTPSKELQERILSASAEWQRHMERRVTTFLHGSVHTAIAAMVSGPAFDRMLEIHSNAAVAASMACISMLTAVKAGDLPDCGIHGCGCENLRPL